MKTLIYLGLFAVSAFIILQACQKEGSTTASTHLLAKKIGEERVAAIRTAPSIEVEEISSRSEAGFSYDGSGAAVDDELVQEIKTLILNDNGYDFEKTKLCLFVPEKALHLKGGQSLTILVSRSCNQLKVIGMGEPKILDCDPLTEKLVQLID